ncbi:MAG: ATP-binding cassette domain-containing protein [Bryobacterales bacterium]|nr:ATP-binding cassette domain-containing protein [Bryobacterales bacterium]
MLPGAGRSVLRFENVSLAFDETPALAGVSFDVREGETRILLGSAGSGKTVLLKMALGLLRPDSGRVFVFGEDITGLPEARLFDIRARIGILFQEGGLFDSLTIEENVAYPLLNQRLLRIPVSEAAPRVEEALRFVELEHTLEKLPSELSGGMRRRVGIARAVVSRPPLVLYDSPTAGLDPITAHTIVSLIMKARDLENTTTLIVTHRYQDGTWMHDFRYNPKSGQLEADRRELRPEKPATVFSVMREGRVVFEGGRAEIEACTDPYVAKFVKH